MNQIGLSIYHRESGAMRKFCRPIYIAAFLVIILSNLPARAAVEEPQVSALAAILMDRDSGRILWSREACRRLPIASTTKIMTALLALESGREEDVVTVSPAAASTEGSSIWLEEGERKTLGELIYGLMLRSGNDAALAIAEHIGGTEQNFVAMMNDRAAALGAVGTHYCNPHGLPDSSHYSTAYDLGLITCRALQNERFRRIVSTPAWTISWPGHPWDRAMSNQNRLLELYPGGDGVKTGWTRAAGRCFVGSATRKGWQLVCVVLNAPQMWEDAALLLDYGFDNYRHSKILPRGRVLCTAPVYKGSGRVEAVVGEDHYLPLLPDEQERLHCHISIDDTLRAPLAAGLQIGEVELYLAGELLGKAGLYAGHAVGRKGLLSYFKALFCALVRGGVEN